MGRYPNGLMVGIVCFATLTALFAAVMVIAITANRATIQDIQQSRYEGCVEQNHRHNQAISTLDSGIGQLPLDRQAQARRTRDFTVALINALVPVRDCDALPNP